HMAESGMANYVAVSFGHSFDMDPYRVSPEFDTYCRYQIEKAVAMLEDHLKGREYLLERGFTAADISLGYTLLFAKFCIQLDMQGRVADYYHRLMARPCLQKALADFPVKNPADPA
ncbi:MAG: glutathione S-transferase C-terminal domain-containing protein, partial [Pseudomonadota bacterium]